MTEFLGVGEIPERLFELFGFRPKREHVSQLLYRRADLFPEIIVVSGRRVVPVSALEAIALELRRRGQMPPVMARNPHEHDVKQEN
jgi:mitochondrial fission protein ELM1